MSHPGPTIRKFNPGLHQSDEEIREQFVVRGHELGLLLDDLRGNMGSPSCQHILVVGPRGRGKTMMLARVAAELRGEGDLAGSLLPVRFMEENPEIFGIADFWLETMFHLANEVEERDAALAEELRGTRAALMPRWREQINGAQARAAVLDAADRLGRRLVLIVENLQSLLRDAHQDFGWQLREVLQTEPQIILLASATSRFRELDDVSEPFFEMLRIVGLAPLDTDECGRLWEFVSGRPATRAEVRPFQILTGGNPRLLVMAAQFARHRSPRRLMSELVALVDEHTEYFRGRLEALAKTERRVYVAVIDLWQPSSASEVSARARVDIRVASTMLGRLVQRGAVVRRGRGRKRLYAAAEPLYSIYYKLRRDRDEAAAVEDLIRFMVACYGVGQPSSFVAPLAAEAAGSDALRRGRARGDKALALAAQKDHRASSASFRAAYAAFVADPDADVEVTTCETVRLVSLLVAAGAPPRDLLTVLDSDPVNSARLHPLVVALQRRAGDRVRAPAEVEAVAADVGRRFDEAEETDAPTAADYPRVITASWRRRADLSIRRPVAGEVAGRVPRPASSETASALRRS